MFLSGSRRIHEMVIIVLRKVSVRYPKAVELAVLGECLSACQIHVDRDANSATATAMAMMSVEERENKSSLGSGRHRISLATALVSWAAASGRYVHHFLY